MPALPSTSAQEVKLGSSHTRPKDTKGTPCSRNAGRPRILVTGVGQHETADHLCGEQPFILGNGVEVVLDGERDDVGILLTGGNSQLHQEGVLYVSEPPAASGIQLYAKCVGLALTQGTGRQVGLEVQPFDLGPDLGQGLGGDLARVCSSRC